MPPVVDRRRERQPDLADHLRPHVERGVRVRPLRKRQRGPVGSWYSAIGDLRRKACETIVTLRPKPAIDDCDLPSLPVAFPVADLSLISFTYDMNTNIAFYFCSPAES